MTITIWLTHPEVSCWNANDSHVKFLEKNLPSARIILCRTKDEFLAALKETEVALIWNFKQEWFGLAPKLKKIITPAAGKDFFHVTPPAHIKIEYSAFHGVIMGETVLGMILAHVRGVLRAYTMQKTHEWARKELDSTNRMLRGSVVTILGFGRIGFWIGRLAKAFGVRIIGIKRNITSAPDYFDKNDSIFKESKLDVILPETDHLVLALPGTKETKHIINPARLKLLPKHAAIYNIGRGNAIDEKALVSSLKAGKLSAAYLDVFEKEPLSLNSPLRKCPNCYIMPHASAITSEYLMYFFKEFLEKH